MAAIHVGSAKKKKLNTDIDKMRAIPVKMKKEMLDDPAYHSCMRNDYFLDHMCQGRLTLEHAFIYAGKQINEKWAIIAICAWSHDVDLFQGGGNLNKEKNQYVALMRATDEELAKYPREDWKQKRSYLVSKYGMPKRPAKFELF